MKKSTHIVEMKWNEATETWRMIVKGFTVQEHKGDLLVFPKDFFNCFSINYMFDGLSKTETKDYRITIEPIEQKR